MKKTLFLICYSLMISKLIISQVTSLPFTYTKIKPLTNTYLGKKIKFVMINYKHNEVIVATRKQAYTITKKTAADAGIIPPLPVIKKFTVEPDIYYGVINPVTFKDFDTLTERILSDDGGIYYNKENNSWYAEVTIPDTAVFYTINTQTMDTVGICIKPVLQIPDSESIYPEVSFGDMNNKVVTTDLLRKQKSIKVPQGYTLIKASVFFAGFSPVVYLRSLHSTDLSSLKDMIDSCKEGSTIVTENVVVKSPSGRLMHVNVPALKIGMVTHAFDNGGPQFHFGSIIFPRAESGRFKRQRKIYISNGCELVSANVYFAGAGFAVVKEAALQSNSTAAIEDLLQLCRPGTSVIFDNIKVKTPKDGIRTIDGVAFSLF